VGRVTGRDRPLIAFNAVDGDGHQLRIFVDSDGDLGLGGVAGEQHQAGESNEEGTHFTLASGPDYMTAASTVPQHQYALNSALVPVARFGHR